MHICVYVVVDPPTREDLYRTLFEAKSRRENVVVTLRAIDDPTVTEDKTVAFAVQQTNQADFGEDLISGYFFEDGQRYLINLRVPFWETEEVSATIAHIPYKDEEEKGSGS